MKHTSYCHYSLAQSYSTQKVAGKFSRHLNSFIIHDLDVDPSHLLLLIESLGTSFDCYVLGACGSTSGLARIVLEKMCCSCIGALITSSKTALAQWHLKKKSTIRDIILCLILKALMYKNSIIGSFYFWAYYC